MQPQIEQPINLIEQDRALIQAAITQPIDTQTIMDFVPGPGLTKLGLRFYPAALRQALDEVLARTDFQGAQQDQGFAAIPVTQRPGQIDWTENDLSGRYWGRMDDRYIEEPFEDLVDEAQFHEITPSCAGTYFEEVLTALKQRFRIGRTRILSKGLYNCNSWHRDPEPRIHIPIVSNPGSLFVVGNHCTHLPADGSVYFTDTRNYHTALNGGAQRRVHLVAAIAEYG